MKVSELEGPALEYWADIASGRYTETFGGTPISLAEWVDYGGMPEMFGWEFVGPIIDKMDIALSTDYCGARSAAMNNGEIRFDAPERTSYLVLAMRCLVASKYGEEVPGDGVRT